MRESDVLKRTKVNRDQNPEVAVIRKATLLVAKIAGTRAQAEPRKKKEVKLDNDKQISMASHHPASPFRAFVIKGRQLLGEQLEMPSA